MRALLRRLGAWLRRLLAAIGAEAEGKAARSHALLGAGDAGDDDQRVLGARFEIEAEAGAGGMGKVYRARDRETGDRVAVKVLLEQGEAGRSRFQREAEVLAELEHPGIVRHVAHGITDGGEPYLAMEWLEGEDLAQRLRRCQLDRDESVAMVRDVAAALGAAHRRGVIHRDVKPSNIFFQKGASLHPKLLDFGIARADGTDRTLTQTGVILGTPGYMAPEQARGEPKIDARVDVFSLGCVLFECLAGRRPFEGDDVLGVLLKVVLEEPPRLGELCDGISAALEDLVVRMMSKAPEVRPRDGDAVMRELESLDGGALRTSEPTDRTDAAPKSALTAAERRVLCVVVAHVPRGVSRSRLSRAVQDGGGRLDVLADGSILVTVPTSAVATDQAAAAARCALALVATAPDATVVLAAGRGVLSAGIPVGDVIERAVGLLERAEPGRVRLDGDAAGLLDARFALGGDEGGLTLGGERAITEVARTLLGKATPCVGRDREIATLEALFDESVRERVARAVIVTAPAGFGKSRLVRELCARIADRGASVEIWIGNGDPIRSAAPFGMIAPAVRRAAGVLDGEPAGVQRRKLEARLGRHVRAADLSRVSEFVGEVVGVAFPDDDSPELRAARQDVQLMDDQTRRAWSDLVASETAAGPLVLVLEDLHWGDVPTVKLCDATLRTLRDRPLVVIATGRPDIAEHFPRLWADRGVLEMRLGELTRSGSERLIREVLGADVPSSTVERISERAGGNAFYLEELIRAVAEDRGAALPETIVAMVQARLEGLPPDVRRALRAASLFGEIFWRGGVDLLLGESDRISWLEPVLEGELCVRRPASKFEGEEELHFQQNLVREAAYAMLTDADRALGHKLAAEWLRAHGESEASVLADHFERGEEPGRAVEWYLRAATQALRANDFAAAIDLSRRGVVCLDVAGSKDDQTRGGLILVQAEAHRWRAQHAESRERAAEATRLLPRGTPAYYQAAGLYSVSIGRLGDDGGFEAAFRDGLVAPATPDAAGARAVALMQAAGSAAIMGRGGLLRAAREELERLPAEELQRDVVVAPRIAVARAFQALYLGDPWTYLEQIRRAGAFFRRAGDLRNVRQQEVNVGDAYLELGAYEEAETALREGASEAEKMGLTTIAAFARHCLGLAVSRLGRLEEGIAIERAAVQTFHEQGDRRLEGAARVYLATQLLLAGEAKDAEAEARSAVELLAAAAGFRAQALAVLARVLLARDAIAEARAAADEASEVLRRPAGQIEEGEGVIRLARAEALHASGEMDGAKAAIAAAADRLRARASAIPEPYRTSFLDRVPENARTLQLFADWTR